MNSCKHCNCTDAAACPGGCFWVLPDVCSACAIALLREARMPSADMLMMQNNLRHRLIEEGAFEMWADAQPVPVPWVILGALLNATVGWQGMLQRSGIQVAEKFRAQGERLAEVTASVLVSWEELAQQGALPAARDFILPPQDAPPATPPPPRLWRPGEPI